MCGIAGFAGDFDADILGRLGSALIHRGPDDAGQVVLTAGGTRVGLANRRLAIQDISHAGHQPMTVRCPACGPLGGRDDERLWISFNGEIYNFPALRARLERSGHTFCSRADTEVLLHLYAEEGADMLRALNGIFALAIYDGRSSRPRSDLRQGDVLIARDGIGVKPLYYTESPEGVLFASEMKSLLRDGPGHVDRSLDPVAVSQYLAYQWVPAPRTVVRSIRKVLPGEYLVLREGKVASRTTFYELPRPTANDVSFTETVEELQRHLEAAVRRQMLSDVPVGAFLSGGLDSSAVVAMVRHMLPSYRLPCYTIAFNDNGAVHATGSDGADADLPYARRVAAHLGVELIPVYTDATVVQRLPDVLFALDEPTGDPAPINAYLIAEQAHRDGLKVLLSGTGGDDIFSGYGRHRWLSYERVWDALPATGRARVGQWARARLDASGQPVTFASRRLLKLFAQIDEPRRDRLAGRFQTTAPVLRQRLLHPSLRSRATDATDRAPLFETVASLGPETHPLDLMLRLEQRHFLADHNLNYLDKMTMAFSVEGRVPLLDLDLVAFAATIPPRYKVSRRRTKHVFKAAMEPFLPPGVIDRPKAGFGVPLRRWMAGGLRELVTDTLSSQAARTRGVFDDTAVQRLLHDTHAGRTDGAYPLFSVFAFETWCQRVVDRPAASALSVGAR
jgi:asparagine synthase (glutamine-hydrolysing)